MKELAANPIVLILLMLGVYRLSLLIRLRSGSPLANPLMVSTVLVIGYLKLCGISYDTFMQTGRMVGFWLQPAIVCLAVPMYQQWPRIRTQWLPIAASQVVGSVVGIITGVLFAHWLGAGHEVTQALAAKSVTMPIALEITHVLGGVPAVTVAAVLLAGLTGQFIGFWLLRHSHIRNRISHSIAQGTASHAIGIAASLEISGHFAAYATLGLIFNGILTSFLAPIIVPLLGV
ncbi:MULTISPECIES: LrgB family protein [Eikenella]|uniref:Murein hydrolase transporter LrgB n=1 Tax=Eikenella longinqua TaxID=1795827 RepID=A0A1A9RWK4_9NEIS|nr:MULTISPECIES: LrgB family protein [Eikenella]OAM29056.1 murein hydrolase transporter LrgB [Eikenella longinqua]